MKFPIDNRLISPLLIMQFLAHIFHLSHNVVWNTVACISVFDALLPTLLIVPTWTFFSVYRSKSTMDRSLSREWIQLIRNNNRRLRSSSSMICTDRVLWVEHTKTRLKTRENWSTDFGLVHQYNIIKSNDRDERLDEDDYKQMLIAVKNKHATCISTQYVWRSKLDRINSFG